MKNDIKKTNHRAVLIDEATDMLTAKYGAKFANSIYKLNQADSNILKIYLIRPGKASDLDMLKNSDADYFVMVYAKNSKIGQITIIKIADIIDYIGKHSTSNECINIDLNTFDYDIIVVDPDNLGETDLMVFDCNKTEQYNDTQASNYTIGLAYINGLPIRVKVNPDTGNVIVF